MSRLTKWVRGIISSLHLHLYKRMLVLFLNPHTFSTSPIPLISHIPPSMNTSNPEPHCLSPSLHLSSAFPGPSFLLAAPDNYSFPSFAFNLSLNTLSFLLLCFFSCFHSQVPDQTALLLGDKLGRSRSGGDGSSPRLCLSGNKGWRDGGRVQWRGEALQTCVLSQKEETDTDPPPTYRHPNKQ